MRYLFAAIVLLFALSAQAQVTCQTYGNSTTCNGSLGGGVYPAPVVTGPSPVYAEQQAAQAAQMQAIVAARAEAAREREAEQTTQQRETTAQDSTHLSCVAQHGEGACGGVYAKPQTGPTPEQSADDPAVMGCMAGSGHTLAECREEVHPPLTPEQVAATVSAAPTEKLKAGAATLEAIMRSAPPDSQAFKDAAQALQATNEELAKRRELKP